MQIGKLHNQDKVSDHMFALTCQPDRRVRVYSGCVVDIVRYHTVDREKIEKQRTVEFFPRETMKMCSSTSTVSSKIS